MSRAMKARQKVKRKGAAKDRVFGCDLVEHLQFSGLEIPQVLKSCTEFVEQHGIVDGIYRLSGVSSNIQKLRQEFDTDRSPDLNKDVYLQDIHCVSSLCKAYFRELPNPLLTYQLYDKFADAVAIQLEEGRLVKIKDVLKELPSQHYRTLEFLMRHLVRMASYHLQTNMHARNLAIVWAPNLLRSKDIETSGFNGTAAFMEVRIQSIVVEFILTHVEQLFGDAPLSGSDRESFRKSLLLPTFSSQVAISDEKYCLSYNVPTMLNQGDGPPQMRPYHTIIELTDHKKGSLKVKKWRSIFNLGRSSHDSKRKLNKAEDKDDKSEKVSLRSAKSMDSLSSMPNTSINDDAGVGRKRSQKELGKRRESFDSPSSHEESFLESDEYPDGKVKGEEGQGESEGEATVKSEPTTPKAKRASLVGGTPQGRSPKAARNRAEKCAGVHISGPFSVTVPFHITSNLTLSRLTRGLECPALSYRSLDTEAAESSLAQAEENSGQKEEEDKVSQSTTSKAGPMEAEPKMESLPGLEEKRLSLEVDDSFSFLDTWQEYSIEGDQPQKKSLQETAHDVYMDSMMGGCPLMDDDIGSGLMNEMIGAGMQPEEFSSMDYLSIEDCMNEYPEEEADRFYVASSCLDNEEPFMEMDPEEVFHSAYDDLSPLATELKKIQQLVEDQSSELGASEDVLDGDVVQESLGEQLIRPSEEGILPKDLSGGSLSEKDRITSASSSPHVPELTESYWSEDTALGHGNNDNQPWTPLKDVAETTATETDLTMKELEDATLRDGVDPMKTSHSVQRESPHPTPNDVPEEKSESYLAPERENQPSRSSHERDGQLEALGLSEREQVLCAPGMSAHAQKEVGKSNGQVGSSGQEKMSESGKGSPQLLATDASSSPVICPGPPLLLGTCLPVDPLLETETSNERSPNPTPFLDTGPEVLSLIEDFPDAATLSDPGSQAAPLSESGSKSHLQKSELLPPAKSHAVPDHNVHSSARHDGSVLMRLTSSTVRVQQVKSVPVVPPKPQFAKMPPALKVKMHMGEASTWPKPAASDKSCGGVEKSKSNGSSLQRQSHPINLDLCGSTTENESKKDKVSKPIGLGKCSNRESSSDSLPQLQCSVPIILYNYDSTAESNRDALQKQRCSMPATLDKYDRSSKSNGSDGDSLLKQRCSMPTLDKFSGSTETSESHGDALPKQRRISWRKSGSMSFDTAVALAKERHLGQAPVRRMQTYCIGDVHEMHGIPKMEKLTPFSRPALKPLGHGPVRSLSSTGNAGSPDILGLDKYQAKPDKTLESQLSASQEALSLSQELPSKNRLSMPRIGRRPSDMEDTVGGTPLQQRRSLAFEIRDSRSPEEF